MRGSIADCNEKTTTININLSKRAAHTYVYWLVVSFFFSLWQFSRWHSVQLHRPLWASSIMPTPAGSGNFNHPLASNIMFIITS